MRGAVAYASLFWSQSQHSSKAHWPTVGPNSTLLLQPMGLPHVGPILSFHQSASRAVRSAVIIRINSHTRRTLERLLMQHHSVRLFGREEREKERGRAGEMMNGKGGCCIAPSKVDRIVMRFRPIAPKPANGRLVPCDLTPEKTEACIRTGRSKRRHVRSGCNNNKSYSRGRKCFPEETDPHSKSSSGGSVSEGERMLTLPLLPDTPGLKDFPASGSSSHHSDSSVSKYLEQKAPIWWSFPNSHAVSDDSVISSLEFQVAEGLGRTVVTMPQQVKLVGSCVMVEWVADTWWVDGDGLGRTDEEKVMSLDRDACPGFVSDGLNHVRWTNGAYRKMVGQADGGEATVWLTMKDKVRLPEPVTCRQFTCRVRVMWGKDRGSLTLPCDVWRMESGGFAWRLDVKAALCLGRSIK